MNAELVYTLTIMIFTALCFFVGLNPLLALITAQERKNTFILQNQLLMQVTARTITVTTIVSSLIFGLLASAITNWSLMAFLLAAAGGLLLPGAIIRKLQKKRLMKLNSQIVEGIQTLASGVRAGLNLVQAMELIVRDAPAPISQEFSHLLSEYEYGTPLDEAMLTTAKRIGSADYRLLFTALHTHRQQGGDLGDTLDRIADSIREIQRLDARVDSLTAQGRATARWLGAMPLVVIGIMFLIPGANVEKLFTDDLGKLILALVVLMNIVGFIWIRKIMDIDV